MSTVSTTNLRRTAYSPPEEMRGRRKELSDELKSQRCYPSFLSKAKQTKVSILDQGEERLSDFKGPISGEKELMELFGITPISFDLLTSGFFSHRTKDTVGRILNYFASQTGPFPEKVSYFRLEDVLKFKDEFKSLFLEKVKSGDYVLVEAMLNIFADNPKEFPDVFTTDGFIYRAIYNQLKTAKYGDVRENTVCLLFKNLEPSVIENSANRFELLFTLLTVHTREEQMFKPVLQDLHAKTSDLLRLKDKEQNTLLHSILVEPSTEYLEFLLSCEPGTANSKNSKGNTALHVFFLNKEMMFYQRAKGQSLADVKLLLKYMDKEAVGAKNDEGKTPIRLFLDCQDNRSADKDKIFNLLLENMPPDARDFKYEDGKTIQALRAEQKDKEAADAASKRSRSESSSPWWGDYPGTGQDARSYSYIGDQGGGSGG